MLQIGARLVLCCCLGGGRTSRSSAKEGQLQVTQLLLLKLLLLPALMVALTLLCGKRDEYGLGLVLLSACPLAQLAFLMCHQYHTGNTVAELAEAAIVLTASCPCII
uniref:Uncharacterized protein n=1 Tax=Tetradesmus obliquus TaxID=3088 RepID=A0A383W5B7_TETOB|eukprot:jgi/Sobl393_1/11433/SZX72825.1